MVDYPYNFKTFVVKALTQIDNLFRIRGLAPGNGTTLALATPAGLALEPYHAVLLSPYSRFPLITLAELGRRGMEGTPVDWSGEGVRVHCFSQVVACKLDQHDRAAPQLAAAAVMSHLGSAVPADPLGFGEVANQPHVLRVVIEQRTAAWRTLRNVADLLRACEEADAQGFSAGGFTRIVCKAMPAAYDTSTPATGTITAASPAAAAFRTALGAVRSAHLFVAAAGSSGALAFFMQPDAGSDTRDTASGLGLGFGGGGFGGGGAGFVEVRPCGWGSEHSERADGEADAMAAQLQRGDDSLRFFALNVEDPEQCVPPDYQTQLRVAAAVAAAAAGASAVSPSGGQWWSALVAAQQAAAVHSAQQSRPPPPRYTPEELLARDQHLRLRPGTLLAMLRHAAGLLGDRSAYQVARAEGRLHGYAVAGGLLLGRPGLRAAERQAMMDGPAFIAAP